MPRLALSADEARLAGTVLDEAAHADLLVLGAEQRREMEPLDLEAGVEIEVETGVDRLLGGAQRLRGTGAELSGQPGRSIVDLAVGYHPIHQPDPQRVLGIDVLSGVDQLLGPGRPDQPRQPLRATATRDDPEKNFWQTKLGALAAHPKVRAERQFQPATESVAGDRRDDRLGNC